MTTASDKAAEQKAAEQKAAADQKAKEAAKNAKSDKDDKGGTRAGDTTETGPHNTEGHFGKYNVVIANDEDGTQTFRYQCANGQEVEMTSEDSGQTWSNDEVGTLGVSGVGDLLEQLDAQDAGDKKAVGNAAAKAAEPAKSSTWSKQ